MSLLFISHDIALASEIADRIAVFRHGRLVEIGGDRRRWSASPRKPTRARCSQAHLGLARRQAARHDRAAARSRAALGKRFHAAAGQSPRSTASRSNVARGETLALVGPSGSGKSTLGRIVLRLIEPDSRRHLASRDRICSRCAARRLRRPAAPADGVPGSARRLQSARHGRRVLDDPLRIHGIGSRAERPAPDRRAARARRPFAGPRASARDPRDLRRPAPARGDRPRHRHQAVADRARRGGFGARRLGARARSSRCSLDLQRDENIAYLFISHDLGVVRAVADRVAIMDAGRIVETGAARQVIAVARNRRPARRWSRRCRDSALRTVDGECPNDRRPLPRAETTEPRTRRGLPQPRRSLPAVLRRTVRRIRRRTRPKRS